MYNTIKSFIQEKLIYPQYFHNNKMNGVVEKNPMFIIIISILLFPLSNKILIDPLV